jgi:hypothetical protein
MSTSEAYLDYAGSVTRRWPASYNEVIMKDCPRCGAGSGELCTTATGRTGQAKMPCLARLVDLVGQDQSRN